MTRARVLTHAFVDHIPSDLAEGTLYVSIPFGTVVHECFCGCGNEVITPLSPTDWQLSFDGESISLTPSIGNWSFDCQSHYWIRRNRVEWAPRWSKEEVEAGRARDRLAKDGHLVGISTPTVGDLTAAGRRPSRIKSLRGLFQRLREWLQK